MASMTMTSSFLGASAVAIPKQLPTTTQSRGGLAIRAATKVEKIGVEKKEEGSNGRREMFLGGVAATALAVAFSLSKMAMADDIEPRRGSAEAKKKYAVVCVTNPTARICRK